MMDFEQSDNIEVIPYEDKPVTDLKSDNEPIKVYEYAEKPKWREYLARAWVLLALTVAFASIFLVAYIMYNPSVIENHAQGSTEISDSDQLPVGVYPENSQDEVTAALKQPQISAQPLLIDESKLEIDINKETDPNYSLAPVMELSDGVKVIIIHSHTSEYVTDTLSVLSAGEVLAQILNSGGITTVHCQNVHDADGTVGAYARMKDSLESLQSEYQSAVIVLDLHDSDAGKPVTLTIGSGFESGWRENFKLACALTSNIIDVETAIRILPDTLGQDSGILTVSVGIGGKEYSEAEGRKAISSLARALLAICEKKAPDENSGAF